MNNFFKVLNFKKMLFPIRCITCGKVINQYHKLYLNMIENGETVKDSLDKLNIKRYCCRRMFICHNDMFDYISEFDKRDYSFIGDKFEKNVTTNIEPEHPNIPPEDKNSDSENSEIELLDENIIDDDITIDEDFDD
jgi:DNA-directed RNA polymerase subunit N (RpoN/RPB10)